MPFNSESASKYGKMGGRPGYELEQAQLDKMRKILDKDLAIIERLQDAEEISPVDREKLQISQSRVMKYLDKLHASRQTQEHSGEIILPQPIIKVHTENALPTNNGNNQDTESETKD